MTTTKSTCAPELNSVNTTEPAKEQTVTLAANHAALVTRMLIVGLQSYAEVMKSNEMAEAYKDSKTYRIPDGVLPADPTGDMATYAEFAEALSWMQSATARTEG